MRLVRSNSAANDPTALTPASVFETKYDWLMRWAMHFAQNDSTVAEDLVQDTFVRLMNSWARIKDNITEVEPVLYSYLRYAFLTEIRRGRRFCFEELALIEFDDLRLSLKEEKSADPIQIQDDLRRIVAYLCWRKRSAKSASVLLLRFFHGYFPDEIARIAGLRRGPVNELLRVAREEVKAYLVDPSRVEIMRQGRPPELMPTRAAVPPDRFAQELRKIIAEARTGPCLDRDQWLRCCNANPPKPLSSELLAHLVSCEHCLEIVRSHNGLPPLSQRSEDQASSLKRRSRRSSGQLAPASKDEIRRVIAGGMERFRQLYQHHPRSLSIVLDGDVLAKRDVSSANCELLIQTGSERALSVVEVVSEQNIPLLTFFVGAVPPQAPPEQRHEVALSDGRKLELRLEFTAEGAVIEVFYHDPALLVNAHDAARSSLEADAASEELIAEAPRTGAPSAAVPKEDPSVVPPSRRRSWWRWFRSRVTGMEFPAMNPMLATAVVCAIATVVLFVLSVRNASVMKPGEMLQQATVSEIKEAQSGPGVVVQTVRIQTPRRKIERTIYRDIQGRRRAREQKLDQADESLRAEVEANDIPWNDPLSVASFRDWHDRAAVERDVVKRPEKGLLTLTSTVAEGRIVSESLTLRESDFHPVKRTVELRDAGTIEIAELNYNVLPWSSVNPDLFESDLGPASALGKGVRPSLRLLLPRILSPMEIDEAELSARLVLNRLHLDGTDRIELVRQPDGVEVKGVVADGATQHQLQEQLHTVPHVTASILTVAQMAARPAAASDVTSISQSSVSTASAPSALERYFVERSMDRSAASDPMRELVDSSFMAKHESEQIADLLRRFSSSETLSGNVRSELSELLIQHKSALLAALAREDRQLLTLQLVPRPVDAATDALGTLDALEGAAERNFVLCTELTSENSGSSRSAQAISAQLEDSIAQLRAVVLHISAAAQLSVPSPGSSINATQNK
jgi:RNA polymerase sigma factor (sigma-70 family)